jgi:hypothetical protein
MKGLSGLRTRDIPVSANQLAVENNTQQPFSQCKGMTGKKMVEEFHKKTPTVSFQNPSAVRFSYCQKLYEGKRGSFL